MSRNTSKATNAQRQPTVYILEFDKPFGKPRTADFFTGEPIPAEKQADPKRCTAATYVGWTPNMAERYAEHVTGKGSKLVAAAVKAHVQVYVAAEFHFSTDQEAWTFEKQLKAKKNTAKVLAALRAGKDVPGVPKPARLRRPTPTVDDWLALN